MGLLDGLIGGAVGAGLTTVVGNLIEQHGGVQGIVKQFETQGLGQAVQSWISTGPNQAISPDQLHKVIGPDIINQLAAKTGMSPQDLAQKLSQLLPQAVDKLTPNGAVPPA